MAKKLSLLLAAVAVLAFAVPAMASAAPKPTLVGTSTGKATPTGTTIQGKGVNVILTSSVLAAIKCEKLNLKGVLKTNSDTVGIIGKQEKAETEPEQFGCTNVNGAVKVTSVFLEEIKSLSDGVAEATFTAIVDVGTRVCTFKGTNVTGSYVDGGTSLTFSNATGVEGGACGTAKLDGVFELFNGSEKLKAVF